MKAFIPLLAGLSLSAALPNPDPHTEAIEYVTRTVYVCPCLSSTWTDSAWSEWTSVSTKSGSQSTIDGRTTRYPTSQSKYWSSTSSSIRAYHNSSSTSTTRSTSHSTTSRLPSLTSTSASASSSSLTSTLSTSRLTTPITSSGTTSSGTTSTGPSTTSFAPLAASSPPTPASTDSHFVVSVSVPTQTPLGKVKRSTNYIGFSGNQAIVVASQADAWPLVLNLGGILGFSGKAGLMGIDATTGTVPLKRTSDDQTYSPADFTGWAIDSVSGAISYPGAAFCVHSDSSIYLSFASTLPADCSAIALTKTDPPAAPVNNTINGLFSLEIEASGVDSGYAGFTSNNDNAIWTTLVSGAAAFTLNQGTLKYGTSYVGFETNNIQTPIVMSKFVNPPAVGNWQIDANDYLYIPAITTGFPIPAPGFCAASGAGTPLYASYNGVSCLKFKIIAVPQVSTTTTTTTVVTSTTTSSTRAAGFGAPTTTTTTTTTSWAPKSTVYAGGATVAQTVTAAGQVLPANPTYSPTCKTPAPSSSCGTTVTGAGHYGSSYTVECGQYFGGAVVNYAPNGVLSWQSYIWPADSFEDCLTNCDNSASCIAMSFRSNLCNGQYSCYLFSSVNVWVTQEALNDGSLWDSARVA